jgi:nucleotide-binding universal stress UspA family protein
MNVLCAIGIQGGAEVVHRLLQRVGTEHELRLLHVIDSGPRHALDEFLHGPGPLRRPRPPPPPPPPGRAQPLGPVDQAEAEAGAAILEEARREAERAGTRFSAQVERGRPEQVIVQIAQQLRCDLIAIQASEGAAGRPRLGPRSVGHTARFVLDHAPCDVLLLRTSESPS